jgi:hypothetical protein
MTVKTVLWSQITNTMLACINCDVEVNLTWRKWCSHHAWGYLHRVQELVTQQYRTCLAQFTLFLFKINFQCVKMQIVIYHSVNKSHVLSMHQGISASRPSRHLLPGVPYFIVFSHNYGHNWRSLNDPHSRCFHIGHNTSLWGGAKRLRNFWRRPNCIALIELVVILNSTTTVCFDPATASCRPNSSEHSTRTVKAQNEAVIFLQWNFTHDREINWLTRSPEISAVDFFLRGCLNGKACKKFPVVISDFKQQI